MSVAPASSRARMSACAPVISVGGTYALARAGPRTSHAGAVVAAPALPWPLPWSLLVLDVFARRASSSASHEKPPGLWP